MPAGITDIINQSRHSAVSQRTAKRRLYENNYNRRIVRKKKRICDENRKQTKNNNKPKQNKTCVMGKRKEIGDS